VTPWKGLILAGGTGSRLAPVTRAVNKHLLPVFDKPMIYYPLSTLMLADIRDITILTSSNSVEQFVALLGDGAQWGINLVYRVQDSPDGIAHGLQAAADELRDHNVALILGDNIFFGAGLPALLAYAKSRNEGATIFGYEVADPSSFGVVTLDHAEQVVDIEEKPAHPKSRIAVTGLYLYDPGVVDMVRRLTPSDRGEIEITDVNRAYLQQRRLRVINFGRGVTWLDGGTPEDLFEAAQFVKVTQGRTGLRIACPEEVAFRRGFVDQAGFAKLIANAPTPQYGAYLERILRDLC